MLLAMEIQKDDTTRACSDQSAPMAWGMKYMHIPMTFLLSQGGVEGTQLRGAQQMIRQT